VGRNKIEIDWMIVDNLFEYGATIKMVAHVIGVSVDTVEKRIKEEKETQPSDYRDGQLSKTRVKLIQKAIEKALGGDNTMMIFCLKNICDWADKKEIDVTQNKPFKFAYDDKKPLNE